MRFIGNKELITCEIEDLLKSKNILRPDYVLFDAFCGTGAVGDYFKGSIKLVVNDMIDWSVVYSKGRINSALCKFKKLGFDPFEYLNSTSKIHKGFFYKNYSPGLSERMYFSKENAGRIDFFRKTIEDWKKNEKINDNEYALLLASLIESISFVSNTAGVYGAFLKHWDSRAKKDIVFRRVEAKESLPISSDFVSGKVEDIIEDIECDVLYLDPPYTQNQYGTQYHLLQTLVLNDSPEISEITGSRPTTPMRSDWSKDLKSHILFDRLIAKTKAKHIVFSYSIDGFLSKSFIEASLKRYGKPETYVCKKISYSKYTNFKSRKKDHYEYLFYVEKKDEVLVNYESPLNYIGSKNRIIDQIQKLYPDDFSVFVDAFAGGFNVGINSREKAVIYNDLNFLVRDLIESFYSYDTYDFLLYCRRIIKKFNLEPKNGESYNKVREYYNSLPKDKRDPRLLFTVIMYGFNQQIRFNSNYDFNNPVGMRWFNDKVLEKFISFSRVIKEKKIYFDSQDYTTLIGFLDDETFVYFDPPYRLTTGAYNDGKRGFKGWGIEEETRLLNFADQLNAKGIKFMISYVVSHKGNVNKNFQGWVSENGYNLIFLDPVPGSSREEVVVINYEHSEETSFHNKKQFSKGWNLPSNPIQQSLI